MLGLLVDQFPDFYTVFSSLTTPSVSANLDTAKKLPHAIVSRRICICE
jgi:hypothetical protein